MGERRRSVLRRAGAALAALSATAGCVSEPGPGEEDGAVEDGENVTGDNATDGNATDGNATDGNVTDENVTDGNATEENATADNATDGNATGNQTAGGAAQVISPDTTIRLGGEVQAWHGRQPPSIENETNPTLALQGGAEYTLVWENMDGQPHNFVLLDGEGNQLFRSDIVSEQGATQRVTFTADPAATEYQCEVHPTTMVGDVEIASG